jgi:uncharacterized protein (DUF2147 family)
MRSRITAALAGLLLSSGTSLAGDPSGVWLTQSGETKVRIAPCGAEYCGSIVWVKNDRGDVNNPDPALRDRSLVGIRMIYGMKPAGDGFSGRLYNPMDGKTYSGKLKTVGDDKLDLAGCVMGVFCKHQVWTRSN